ncbi:T9SS type A sorting domain-containing protein [candidate division KSB1 bacterium]|nr:T9SS type A sorting domain-containing protein [candidate division KSB1 bacterium]
MKWRLIGTKIQDRKNSLMTIQMICCLFLLPGLLLAQQFKIMPLGDSITEGYWGSTPIGGYRDDLANMLQDEGVSFDFVGTLSDYVNAYPRHEGHAGKETSFLVQNVKNYLQATQPDVILLHIGTNDINEGNSAASVKNQTDLLMTNIYNHDPQITILVASIIPRKDDTGENKNVEHTNLAPMLEQLVQQKNVLGFSAIYVPVNELFRLNTDWQKMLSDKMHPTNSGYEVIANGFYKKLMDYLTIEDKLITENFNRQELADFWAYGGGNYQILNKQFTNGALNNDANIAVYRFEDDPTSVSFTYGTNMVSGGNGDAGVAVRLADGTKTTSGYAIIKESASADLVLYQVKSGRLSTELHRVSSLLGLPAINDTFRVDLINDAQLGQVFECYLNGQFDGRLTDPNRLEGRGTKQHAGVILKGSQNNIIDNFNYGYKEVKLYNGPSQIMVADGEQQEGIVNTIAAKRLVVQVLSFDGSPATNTPVDFKLSDGNGVLWTLSTNNLTGYEAEVSTLTPPMAIETDHHAAGGNYLSTEMSCSPKQGIAELQLNIEKAGTYRLWGRTKSGTDGQGSFYVTLDNQTEFLWSFSANQSWHWSVIGENSSKSFDLTAGRHTIKIKNNEAGIGLDRIIIASNLQFTPADSKLGSEGFNTDSNGKVQAKFIYAKSPGLAKVKASLPDFALSSKNFTLNAITDAPVAMVKINGDLQVGKPQELLPIPLEVKLTDQYGNPTPGKKVNFKATTGNGTFSEAMPVLTNDEGIAQANYTLGPDAGQNVVEVTCVDHSLQKLTFTSTAQKVLFAISGKVSYYADQHAIAGVKLTASGGFNAIEETDKTGSYQFKNIPMSTDFKITPSKTMTSNQAHAVVDLYNAALIMRQTVGLEKLDRYQLIAANVDFDNDVDAYDAANIARFIVELPPYQENIKVGEWLFIEKSKSYSNILIDQKNQNFLGIIMGDVVGRGQAAENALARSNYNEETQSIQYLMAGDTLIVPFTLDKKDIIAAEFHYKINRQAVEFIDIQKTAISKEFTIFHNVKGENLMIAMFSPYPTTQTGRFIDVRFQQKANWGTSPVIFEKYRLNNDPYTYITSISEELAETPVPTSFSLTQNYPNPFSSQIGLSRTVIQYLLPQTASVQLTIYNLLGQEVYQLVNEEQAAGIYQIGWDGRDMFGQEVAAGVYLYQLKSKNIQITKRMMKVN